MFKQDLDRRIFAVAAALVMLFAVSFSVDAQAKSKTNRPKPAATPTPVPLDSAQIISRAGDQVEPTILVPQPETKPAEEAIDPNVQKMKDLSTRVKKLESAKADPYDERQKRLLLNLDILTRAEQRSESLRKQLFEMIEKESSIKSRLDQNDSDSRPESINRSVTFAGSMRPEELRDMRKKSLDAERQNMQALLAEVQSTRANLASNLAKSDALVDKLRTKLEKDIDDSFKDDTDK